MMNAFERISQGLKEAIAHASGEEVEGLVLHTAKVESKIVKDKTSPIPKRFATRFVTENEQHIS
jgi:hypothetical protein